MVLICKNILNMEECVKVNGVDKEVAECHVEELLDILGFGNDRIVIEVDGVIVPREAYGRHWLKGDERVEIVRFVGGG